MLKFKREMKWDYTGVDEGIQANSPLEPINNRGKG